MNLKVSHRKDSSEHPPHQDSILTSLKAKTDETENYEVKDEGPHVDKGKNEDTNEIDWLLNVNELNLGKTFIKDFTTLDYWNVFNALFWGS